MHGLAARSACAVLPGAVFAAGFAFVAANALRVGDWAVMTDELLYSKLATAIADSGSPVPTIHGEYYGALAQLYPLLLVPLYARLDAPAAFQAAHGLNAALLASVSVPAYLLARTVVSKAAAAAVALAAVATPWAVLAGFLMSESAAYAAFAWAVLAMHRVLVSPSPRADVLALAAVAVAFLARTQFVALVALLPVAVVAYELRTSSGGLRARATSIVRRHRVLAAVYGALALVAVLLAATRSLDALLGTYAVTATEGSPLPSGVWTSAVAHLVAVSVGVGVLPVLLAAAWAVTTLVRSATPQSRALAVLVLLIVPLLSLQVASYDLRFGETDLVRDRYLFYVVPLVLAAAAAALLERPPSALALAATAGVFVVAVRAYDFPVVSPFTVDSPVALVNERITEIAGDGSARLFTAFAAALLVVALIAARSLASRATIAAVVLGVTVVFGAVMAQDAFGRVLDRVGPSGRTVGADAPASADWIDDALPSGAKVAVVPFPIGGSWETSAVRWWDVEFWNTRVVDGFVDPSRTFSYTPFPVHELSLDWETGRLRTDADVAYVVVAGGDSRFRIAGPRRAARAGLEVIAAERPYRAEWATRGLDPDGWVRPGRAGVVRVYARPGAGDEIAALEVVLKAPEAAAATYSVDTRRATAAPDAAVVERFELCVPSGGRAELSLSADAAARIGALPVGPAAEGDRLVGVRVEAVVLRRGGACTA